MKARYVQKGESIDYTPIADVAAGDVVIVNDLLGIVKLDISAGTLGALALVGVYDVEKATGASTAITKGAKLYWDADNKVATASAGSNKYMGNAVDAAADADETVRVRLDGPVGPTSLPTADDAIADAGAITADADAVTATSPTWGDTTSVDQAAALQTFSDAVVADLTAIGTFNTAVETDLAALHTKVNAILAAMRTFGVIDTE